MKPLELFVFSGVLAIFAGLVVLMASRSFTLTLIFAGIAFFLSLLFVAFLGMGGKTDSEDAAKRSSRR